MAGILAAAAIFVLVFPAINRSARAVLTFGQNADGRLKSDVDIIAAYGELNVAGAFDDSNGNGDFEIFLWAMNTSDVRITDFTKIDVFLGAGENFSRIPHEDEVAASVYPRWAGALTGGNTEWAPDVTLKITVTYSSPVAQGTYAAKVVIPTGITDDHYFIMPPPTPTPTPTPAPTPTPTP